MKNIFLILAMTLGFSHQVLAIDYTVSYDEQLIADGKTPAFMYMAKSEAEAAHGMGGPGIAGNSLMNLEDYECGYVQLGGGVVLFYIGPNDNLTRIDDASIYRSFKLSTESLAARHVTIKIRAGNDTKCLFTNKDPNYFENKPKEKSWLGRFIKRK